MGRGGGRSSAEGRKGWLVHFALDGPGPRFVVQPAQALKFPTRGQLELQLEVPAKTVLLGPTELFFQEHSRALDLAGELNAILPLQHVHSTLKRRRRSLPPGLTAAVRWKTVGAPPKSSSTDCVSAKRPRISLDAPQQSASLSLVKERKETKDSVAVPAADVKSVIPAEKCVASRTHDSCDAPLLQKQELAVGINGKPTPAELGASTLASFASTVSSSSCSSAICSQDLEGLRRHHHNMLIRICDRGLPSRPIATLVPGLSSGPPPCAPPSPLPVPAAAEEKQNNCRTDDRARSPDTTAGQATSPLPLPSPSLGASLSSPIERSPQKKEQPSHSDTQHRHGVANEAASSPAAKPSPKRASKAEERPSASPQQTMAALPERSSKRKPVQSSPSDIRQSAAATSAAPSPPSKPSPIRSFSADGRTKPDSGKVDKAAFPHLPKAPPVSAPAPKPKPRGASAVHLRSTIVTGTPPPTKVFGRGSPPQNLAVPRTSIRGGGTARPAALGIRTRSPERPSESPPQGCRRPEPTQTLLYSLQKPSSSDITTCKVSEGAGRGGLPVRLTPENVSKLRSQSSYYSDPHNLGSWNQECQASSSSSSSSASASAARRSSGGNGA
eukprot:RCo052656